MTSPQHRMMIRALAIGITLLLGLSAWAAQTVLLDSCEDLSQWKFSNGGEFPGAQGGIEPQHEGTQGAVQLRYDFTKGGQYVAALYAGVIPPSLQAFQLHVRPEQDCRINYRVVDSNDRIYQATEQTVEGLSPQTLTLPVSGKWAGAWGGRTATPQPVLPVKQVWVMLCKGNGLP
ncbi:MAG TPA: hypothetical protein VHV83_13030, partial [Armatimonadota bacterium]|nr:hypothetical protein [Armatimonadota bacterium]